MNFTSIIKTSLRRSKTASKILAEHVFNPVISKKAIPQTDEYGKVVSIFEEQKRLFGKPRTIENKIPEVFSDSEMAEENPLVYEFFCGDKTSGKNFEFTSDVVQKIEDLIQKGVLNKEYTGVFEKNINKNGIHFIEGVYNDIAKSMGFKKYPDLAFREGYGTSSFNPRTIIVAPESFVTKEQQVNAIRHELEHFRQEKLVYDVFGEDAYINAKVEPIITGLKVNDGLCKSIFGKTFKELSESEINTFKAKKLSDTRELCSVFRKAGSLKISNAEKNEATIYLDALKNYKTPTMLVDSFITPEEVAQLRVTDPQKYNLMVQYGIEYNKNPLEKGAVKEGKKIEQMFNTFIELFS